ncbi:hypothetical protein [Flavobacterium hungaricum]|uniref:Uncharacterized protein n=1 Tax=Flavobacterium hungaricum TaxID=2082725 RepID=A0ABR9TLW2_9FLAO|nr:hypothetical protein [Flavobacterium hungaricum]MBE8725829.1 hypothetical protein [Flavobacterium hungaricum]
MKINILKSKIKRSNLKEYSGDYFRDDSSQIVVFLNKEGKSALFGIQKEEGIYTIVGKKSVYYSTIFSNPKEIPLSSFSEILHQNALKRGKGVEFEFLQLNDNEDSVWLHNQETMNALWNIILWING